MTTTTIFVARQIHTLDHGFPYATAVAVRDGRILGVGTPETLAAWGDATIDDTFADSVLLPGFVEAHSHILEGGMWAHEYVGYFDRTGPDGVVRPGSTTLDAALARMREIEAAITDPEESLLVWGFDPIYFPGDRLTAKHLDTISRSRPILVLHASSHLATVNTALMERDGFAEGVEREGLPLDEEGKPIGELQEFSGMALASDITTLFLETLRSVESIERMGQIARRSGLTTITELGITNLTGDGVADTWLDVVGAGDYPVRVAPFHGANNSRGEPEEVAQQMLALRARSNDKCRLGNVKLILDGSIQGFTARLNPPGYLGDKPNGQWLLAPERFSELLEAFHRAGVLVHVHCNGDEAVDLFLDTFEPIQRAHPWGDHRHTVQHCQLTSADQYRRMAALGLNANIFSNHIWYWGDQHHDITVGHDRAYRMNACATADREGVRYSVHCDAAVTPFGSLHTAWCAVNRVTPSGRVLGPDERISVDRAMRAVTVDAAHQLKMDNEIGTISAGKRADFAALAEDPYEVDPMKLRDIEVHGTVLDGAAHRL